MQSLLQKNDDEAEQSQNDKQFDEAEPSPAALALEAMRQGLGVRMRQRVCPTQPTALSAEATSYAMLPRWVSRAATENDDFIRVSRVSIQRYYCLLATNYL
jgi:hypothetical protein